MKPRAGDLRILDDRQPGTDNRRMATTHRWAILLTFVFAFQGVSAMSFLNPTKTCVFSAVKARLTLNGEPLKGATVIRRWEWHELKEESTQTDDQGAFAFPAVFESSITRVLPLELVVAQGLYVKVSGKEQKFWSNSKREPKENTEYNGQPISLACELSDEMKTTRENGSIRSTLCRWVP
jgi:hypothetical protein